MSEPGTVETITFGCRLNIVESEAMRAAAQAAGLRDLTIVNSCAVTAEAARQARQAIRRAKREHPDRRVIVTGCAAETETALFAAMPEVDAIVPNAVKAEAATWRGVSGADQSATPPRVPTIASPPTHTRGFVEIQNGCDHRCTFCIIPFGRGVSRSRPVAAVIERVRALAAAGALEVVLTGVDVTSYGGDLPGTPSLGALVRAILAAVPELPRLRLSSLDCIEADPLLLDALAAEPRLMPHLHLSIQAGSDLILKRMKRRHGRADVQAFCASVRRLRPDIVFGADFIAGFPTETAAMAAETRALIEACDLTYIHVFPFSPRPGTPAARMPAVAPGEVRERAAHLRALGTERLRSHLAGQTGRHITVLTERGGKGHAEDFSPVRLPDDVAPGRIVRLRVTGSDGQALTVAA